MRPYTLAMLALGLLSLATSARSGPLIECEYKHAASRRVAMRRHGHLLIGRLDAYGNFIDSASLVGPSLQGPTPVEAGALLALFGSIPLINEFTWPSETVYEYRSGYLVKGVINWDGNFVPEVGSKVIPFTDYPLGKGPLPRIYNLPGKFVPIGKRAKEG